MASSTTTIQDNIINATEQQNQLGLGQGPSGLGRFNIQRSTDQFDEKSKTVTFSQTFKQSIKTNGLGSGGTVISNQNNELCYQYDWGANYIPYQTTRAAVRIEHLKSYLPYCNSYEILNHSVELSNLISYKDDVQADGRIVSTFLQDTVEVYHDSKHRFRPLNFKHTERNRSLYDVNAGFRHVEPTSLDEMTLPTCALVFSPEMYNATTREKLNDLKRGVFDPYHGLFSVSTWNGSTPLKFSHDLHSGRIPVGLYDGCTKQPCNQTIIAAANSLLDTVWGVQANVATQVNRSPILPAPTVLLRLAPVWQTTGLTSRRAQFDAKYSCTIKFHFSAVPGYKMLSMGNQGVRLAFPFNDPFSQIANDDRHYHSGVHAENFVIPLTGYVINETQKRSDLPPNISVIPDRSTVKTASDLITDKLEEKGYSVAEKLVNQVGATTKVESLFKGNSDKAEVEPEFRTEILTDVGFDADDIATFDAWIKEATEGAIKDSKGEKTVKLVDGLITDDNNKPKLPVSASVDEMNEVKITNFTGLRPGEAWRAIGADTLPANPRRDNQGFYTPWPIGVSLSPGKVHCSFDNLQRIKGLNKARLQQLSNVNRALKEQESNNVNIDIKGAAKNYQEVAPTIPLEVTAPRAGPLLVNPKYGILEAAQAEWAAGATGTTTELKEKGITAHSNRYQPY